MLRAAALAVAGLASAHVAQGVAHGAAPGSASTPPHGSTVAILELAAPAPRDFVLHGTVPVPEGTFPRADGRMPFQVRDSDGALVPAQVEIVSRYPARSDGADVVEILAHVQRPTSATPGTRIQYEVVLEPRARANFRDHPRASELIAMPGGVVVRARDVFGNLYTADLLADLRSGGGSLRVLKDGSKAIQTATHESLYPTPAVAGPAGTLPHLMGVHAYTTQWSILPFISLDLRVHSAHSGLDPNDVVDDALGKIYFESFELVLPPEWVVLNATPDPYTGTAYAEGNSLVWPIVAPIPGGQGGQGGELHVMPQLSQFHRRLMLAPAGMTSEAFSLLNEDGLGFCREGTSPSGPFELWSWWNSETARYFPQRHRLPSLDHANLDALRAGDGAALSTRRGQIQNGSTGPWPTQSTGLGWAHPWGIGPGGMVSGLEIHLYEGVTTACAASNDGYRLAQVVHRMLSDRQPNVLFNANGRHTRREDWIVHHPQGDVLPVWWFGSPLLYLVDPFGVTSSPNFQRVAALAQGRQPQWENELLSYEAIDAEHLIRYTRMAKVLAWLGNDAIAKDDLLAQAEGVRFGYSELPQAHGPGGWCSTGMFGDRLYVDYNPGWGFAYGRAEGWGLDTMNAAYSLGDPAWRAEVRPWFDLVIDLLRDGQMECTGIIQASYLSNVFNGAFRCRQSIEAAICENAIVGMRESVFHGDDNAKFAQTNDVLVGMFYAMISPLVWDDVGNGPWAMMAVGTADVNSPPFCTYVPPQGNYGYPDHYQIWSSFAYAYEITRDPRFLNKAADAMGGSNLDAMCEAMGAAEIQNRAALVALVQSLQ